MILKLGSVTQWKKDVMVWDCVGGGIGHSAPISTPLAQSRFTKAFHYGHALRLTFWPSTMPDILPNPYLASRHILPGLERYFTADILPSCVIPLRPLFTLEIRRIDLSTI